MRDMGDLTSQEFEQMKASPANAGKSSLRAAVCAHARLVPRLCVDGFVDWATHRCNAAVEGPRCVRCVWDRV